MMMMLIRMMAIMVLAMMVMMMMVIITMLMLMMMMVLSIELKCFIFQPLRRTAVRDLNISNSFSKKSLA
jgi:hypothetical protein